jgi:hypothetical protein
LEALSQRRDRKKSWRIFDSDRARYQNYANPQFPMITIQNVSNGVIAATGEFTILVPSNLPTTSPTGFDTPISFAVDPQEKFLYWYLSSTGSTTVADTAAIYSLKFANSSATLVSTVPLSGPLLVGAQ